MPQAVDKINDIDSFLNDLVQDRTLEIEIEIENTLVNLKRNLFFSIIFNQQPLLSLILESEQKGLKFKFSLLANDENRLEFVMKGKRDQDTIIGDNNEIIADSMIRFTSFKINNYEMMDLSNDNFIRERFHYILADSTVTEFKKGFWHNSRLVFDFQHPFVNWFNSITDSHTDLMGDHKLQGIDYEEVANKVMNTLNLLDR